MKLYGTYASPFTARVLLAVRAKGSTIELVPPPGEGPAREAYLEINPTGKFPFLDDDGFYLSESAVIADYLDTILPGPSLWPSDPKARARAAMLARFVDIWAAPGYIGFMKAVFSGGIPTEENRKSYLEGIRLIDQERNPADRWLYGDAFGHPDAALIPLLLASEKFDDANGFGSHFLSFPRLAEYWDRAQQEPIVAEVLAPAAERIKGLKRGDFGMSHFPVRLAEAAARLKAEA